MIVPVSDVTCNNKTVGDYKLEKDKCTNRGNEVCFIISFT